MTSVLPSAPLTRLLNRSDTGIDMGKVACLILGGGQGTRLFPLTTTRCKPAICFGGRYCLIDVPVSNAINSHCNKIFIITQFLSSSLHRHIFQTYQLDRFSSGFIEILAAEQKPSKNDWYQGTANAVRDNLDYFVEVPVDYFLILSGDQLYNMDFRPVVRFAKRTDADLVIASLPVDSKEAQRMGVLKIDERDFITDFYEKPKDQETLERMKSQLSPGSEKQHLASMGIYLFKREALIRLLAEDPREDFGKHLIPTIVQKGKVAAYLYDGYWEDIGTIDSFYEANMALTEEDPPFKCYDEKSPIHTCRSNLPGPKISHTQIHQSIICEGSIVDAKEISHSILGPRSIVREGTVIRKSYVMGNEFYQPPIRNTRRLPNEIYIGRDCLIEKAIIDKNVCIGDRVKLTNVKRLKEYDGEGVYIRDGIVIVTRGAHIPDDFEL